MKSLEQSASVRRAKKPETEMHSPSKRLPYFLLAAAALVLLVAGIFIGWNQWITVVIVAVPAAIMAGSAMLSRRSGMSDEGEFHIESRGALSEVQMHVDIPVEGTLL